MLVLSIVEWRGEQVGHLGEGRSNNVQIETKSCVPQQRRSVGDTHDEKLVAHSLAGKTLFGVYQNL